MLIRINYWITVLVWSNLAFVTFAVWLYPKVWIFQVSTTLAWIMLVIQYVVALKLKKNERKL